MRFLIAGGAGYRGSILTPTLPEKGQQVTVLYTFARGSTERASRKRYRDFTPGRGDARNEGLLYALVPKADVIIPLAALVGAPLCMQDPIPARTLNQDAVEKIVKRVPANQMFVYPTTNSGCGIGVAGQFCTEEIPVNPLSIYGVTKIASENAVPEKNGIYSRLATVFGTSLRMRINLLVNDFIWRTGTDRAVVIFQGHFKRNYIHLRDVVKGFLHGIENHDSVAGRAYNRGLSSANLSKLGLCSTIEAHVPNSVFLEVQIGEDPDKRDYIASNQRLEDTGWSPHWDLDRGIRELLSGYRMLRDSVYSNI